MKNLNNYLLEAAKKNSDDIGEDNPFRAVGFDSVNKRLGWVMPHSLQTLQASLDEIKPVLEGKERFIFVGMGGSINGIKPLISLFKAEKYHTIDSLDPRALSSLLSLVNDYEKTLVIPISKSATTQETQLISNSLRDAFINKVGNQYWQKHFLWLSDTPSFSRLDSLGWQKAVRAAIQLDKETDIGGRFSSPHTLIFLLPLYLLLGKNEEALTRAYSSFAASMGQIREEALRLVDKYKDNQNAYFSPCIDERLDDSFSSWIVQLFQESLGSKCDGLDVKTITNLRGNDLFSEVELPAAIDDPVTALMSQMYFFQAFVAFFAAVKKLNFVDQGYVEKYKNQMRELAGQLQRVKDIEEMDEEGLIRAVKERCTGQHRFIEIVLYFYPGEEEILRLKKRFSQEFPDKSVLVFIGSDWNHQSYQAAFASRDTFFVLLSASDYGQGPKDISSSLIRKNVESLLLIARATHLTIVEKSVLFSLSRPTLT
jgi:glucose-6-phosphate isomerase